MLITIDNRIRCNVSDIPPDVLKKVKETFKYRNPDFYKKRNMGYFTGNTQQYIATYRLDNGGESLSLPRGCLNRFVSMLYGQGLDIQFQCVDNRRVGSQVEFTIDPEFEPRPYQIQATEKIIDAQTGLLKGGAGSGKTEILLSAIAEAGLKTGVLVHDKNLLNQWVERIEKRLLIPRSEIGIVGQGKFKIGKNITIMMQQTARNKIAQIANRFGFLACDEVHHAAANTFLKVIDSFTAKYRIGCSATIRRQDLKHFLTHDLFGEIAFEITRDQLEDLGFLTKVILHVIPTRMEYDYLNEQAIREAIEDRRFIDFESLSARDKRDIADELGFSRKQYPEYLTAISQDRDRNNLIYRHVKAEYDKGSKILIFTKRRSHCDNWRKSLAKVGIEVVILWGSQNRKETKRIEKDLKRLKDGKVRIAIGTVIDEGIDLPAIDCGFVTYRNSKNPGQLEQQAGRLARLFTGKTEGRLYYVWDRQIERFKNDAKDLQKHFDTVIVHNEKKKLIRSGR